VTIKLD
jgi:hypothetical protein